MVAYLLRGAVFVLVFTLSCGYGSKADARSGRLFAGKKFLHGTEKLEKNLFSTLKKMVIGSALVSTLACSGLYCGYKTLDAVHKHRALKSNTMLDTIIVFEDGILGRNFHYVLHGRNYAGRVVDWQQPYTEIVVRSSYDSTERLIPIKALRGRAVEWHIHEGAEVTFLSSERGTHRLYGNVYSVFDNSIYQVLAHSAEDMSGNVTPLETWNFEFITKEDIATLRLADD